MLVASAKHPAMLSYLDNASSDKDAPNENYARELLELHTVGVGAGYTETMVKSAARLLTGLSVDDADRRLPLRHVQARHRAGAGARLLRPQPLDVRREGRRRATCGYLATHPATARRIARKLAVRFVSDAPPAALVAPRWPRSTWSTTPTSVPVLRALFRVQGVRPVVGRQGEAPVRGPGRRRCGRSASGRRHPAPTGCGSCTGSPASSGSRRWAGTRRTATPTSRPSWQSAGGTLARWNSHLGLAAGWWPNDLRHPPLAYRLRPARPQTHGALVDAAAAGLGLPRPTDAVRQAICTFLGEKVAGAAERRRPGARLAAALRASRCCSTAPRRRPMSDGRPTVAACACGTSQPAGLSRRRLLGAAGAAVALGVVGGLVRDTASTRLAFAGTAYAGDVLRRALAARWLRRPVRRGAGGRPGTTPRPGRASASRPARCCQLDATFGLHPALAPLKPFWDAGTFGAVHAAGQPDPTRSHFQAMEEMERAAPGSSVRTGWLDRVSSAQGAGGAFATVGVGADAQPARAHRAGARAAHRLGRRLLAVRCRRRGGAGPLERRPAADAPRRPRRRGDAGPADARGARDRGRAAGRRLRDRERRRLPRRRPRRRRCATSRSSSRPASGCGWPPSTSATGTCTRASAGSTAAG